MIDYDTVKNVVPHDGINRGARRQLLCGLALLSMASRGALGQKTVDVYYTHSSATDPGRIQLSYRLPGQDTGFRAGGLRAGDQLSILQGGQACFHVGNANPLLYTYSRSSAVLEIKQPEGLAALLTGLQPLAGLIPSPANPSLMTASDLRTAQNQARLGFLAETNLPAKDAPILAYSSALTDLQITLKDYENLRLQDTGEWEKEFAKEQALGDATDRKIKAANDAFESAKKASVGTELELLKQLNVLQGITTQRIEAIKKEFVDANSRFNDPLCTSVDKDRLKMSLSIKSRLSENKEPKFAVKDELVSVTLDPVSDAGFELAPLVILAPNVSRQKFAIQNDVVTSAIDRDPLVRPGILALGRLWSQGWLWAGIGVTKGKEATPDLFFGLVARPGLSLVGTQLSVGAGLGVFQVPVGLKQGKIGQPLPPDVPNLDKILDRSYRSGLAVTFSISGFELGKTDASK